MMEKHGDISENTPTEDNRPQPDLEKRAEAHPADRLVKRVRRGKLVGHVSEPTKRILPGSTRP